MIRSEHNIRVRYAESDQMGYVHHSCYALYLEEARMQLLKEIGIHPEVLEEQGVIMPVADLQIRYGSPLRYGDIIRIETCIAPPFYPRLKFRHRIFRQDEKMVTRAQSTLVFADRESGSLLPESSITVLATIKS